jgi:amino acid adenylation domain-containing protein
MDPLSSRIAALSPKKQALLAQRRRGDAKPAAARIPRRPPGAPARLSFAQERLWFLDRLEPGSPAYNLLDVVRLSGSVDLAALAAALRGLLCRHEVLRTVFSEEEGVAVQAVAPVPARCLEIVDLTALPAPRREPAALALAAAEARLPYDLVRGPVFRARLLRLERGHHLLLLGMHHIVADAWSFSVFTREMGALYSAFLADEPPLLPEPEIQYADFAAWQRDWLTGAVLHGQLDFWRRQLAGAPLILELPGDRPRPPAQTFCGALRPFALPRSLATSLRSLALASGSTLFMVLLAAWNVVIQRWSGRQDILVGSPVAGRTRPETEPLIGLFVNTLVLRTDLSGEPSFHTLLGRVRETTLGGFAHQDLPFERLVEELQPQRDPARSPLVQMLFVLQNAPAPQLELSGLTLAQTEMETGTAKFDLSLFFVEGDGGLAGALEYNTDLFDGSRIERLASHLTLLLGQVAADPKLPISRLELLSPAERQQQLCEWNDTDSARRSAPCLHHLFERQAALRPEAAAALWNGREIRYGELDLRANRLARHLWSLGVRPDRPVGLCVDRTPEMLAGLLGILKTGAPYVPLDPSYPAERLELMARDAGLSAVVTVARLVPSLPGAALPAVLLDADAAAIAGWSGAAFREAEAGPDHLAYVIFTSGSTGRPKGVALSHGVLANLLEWQEGVLPGPARVLQFAPLSFDVHCQEIFSAWQAGGSVVLVDDDRRRNPEELLRLIDDLGVERLFLPFVALQQLAAARSEAGAGGESLREIVTAGEQLQVSAAVAGLFAALPACRLHNHYGPSETHVVTALTLAGDPRTWPALPSIGRPVANARIDLLDRELRILPSGVPGELYLGGPVLARGYVGRPDLTAERFVPSPTGDGERLYRTGDLARFLPDGQIEFLGRVDHQVKVRGFRIELGEIEAVLCLHPGVREAAAGVRTTAGERRLVGYLVPEASCRPAPDELRELLRQRLPDYMVPASYAILDALPLTPSGKVDRRALEQVALETAGEPRGTARVTPTEELIIGIWADMLGLDPAALGPGSHFFELGGHSLLATRVVSRLRQTLAVEIPLRRLFEAPTVAALAAEVEAVRLQGETPAPPLRRAPRDRPLPLSFAQERLWFLDQLEPGLAAYNLPEVLRVSGRLDIPALAASLREIVRRHEVLRTTLRAEDGVAVQVIAPDIGCDLPVVDLGGLPATDRESEVRRLAAEEAARPFDLAAGPVLRVRLLRLAPEAGVVLFNMHHVASDAWSIALFVSELGALYRAAIERQPSPLPQLAIQYADYAVWQRGWMVGEVLAEQLAHWRRQLAGAPLVLELPTDRPRPAAQTFRGAVRPFALPGPLAVALRGLGRSSGGTLFMVLLSAWSALLQRYTGQDDLLVGSPVAGRVRREIEPLLGLFVNTLVLRADLSGRPDFVHLLARMREMALAAYAHQELPFERLVEELQPERDPSRSPLVQALFVLQNAPQTELCLPGVTFTLLEAGSATAKLDLTLGLVDSPGAGPDLAGSLEYSTDLFEEATMERLLGHWTTLLAGIVADPRRPVAELPLLARSEQEQILGWADGGPGLAARLDQLDLVGRIRRRAELAPAAIAVTAEAARLTGHARLTYSELVGRADALAGRLWAAGVRAGDLVGICAERSPELIVGLLGVLAAGAGYVPLDPAYPAERLEFLITDARLAVLLTQGRLEARLPRRHGARVLLLDGPDAPAGPPPPVQVSPDAPAYLIYTSGSTGRPKGARVHRHGLANLLDWYVAEFALSDADRFLLLSSFSFDLTQKNLLAPLLVGGRLCLPPDGYYDPAALARAIRGWEISRVNCTPSAFYPLIEQEDLPALGSLRTVFLGGEPITPSRLALWPAWVDGRAEVVNTYGPTECSDVVAFHRLRPDAPGSVPLGRPVPGARLLVLDRELRLLPAGLTGEICIGGEPVGNGYPRDAALTAQRFIPDPFAGEPGARLYRTGDLGRVRDGILEYLGRTDHQVKVRGFRIELGEVEAALAGLRGVRRAAVLALETGGDRRLVAFVEREPESPWAPAALREQMQSRLPDPMIPTAWVEVESMPLTPNGKADRGALARLGVRSAGQERVAARTPVEDLLAGIWADLLGREPGAIGPDDSFFDLGGHSLLATRLVSRLRAVLEVELPVRVVFEAPTLTGLARAVLAERTAGKALAAPPLRPVSREGELPLSFAQERLWFLARLAPESGAYNVPILLDLAGALDLGALAAALDEVVGRHEVLRTTFSLDAGGEGRPIQVISAQPLLERTLVDLRSLPAGRREAVGRALIEREIPRPFDLQRGPLLRALLLRLEPERHQFLLTLHHVVTDGWSTGILVREMGEAYAAGCRRERPLLPALPVQYADFAVWQRGWLRGAVLDHHLAWWRESLAGAPPLLDLPADRPRPARPALRGDEVSWILPRDLSEGLLAVGRGSGVTLFMTLLAAFQVLLARSSGQTSVVVGSPVANRTRVEIEPLIGFFVNTLALRLDVSDDPGIRDVLARVREVTLGAYVHQELPFERLVEELQPERHLSYPPIFQAMFALDEPVTGTVELSGLRWTPVEYDDRSEKFDLSLGGFESAGEVSGALSYSVDLFDRSTAVRLVERWHLLLAGLVADPACRVSALPLLAPAERAQLASWSRGCSVLVLDRNGALAPVGVPGELCLRGQLAGGNLPPALAAEQLVPDPLTDLPGARLYRTAELARVLPNGHLELLGRIDRIDRLGRADRIERPDRPSTTERPASSPPAPQRSTPKTPGEELLAGIWAEVLRCDAAQIGSEDDFFALGGHSLLANQVIVRMGAAFGVDVPLRTLFEHPTVAGLAAAVEEKRGAGAYGAPVEAGAPLVPVPRDVPLPLSFSQERLWILDQLEPGSAAYNLPGALQVEGRIDVAALAASFTAIVRRHEALRTTFREAAEGPVQVIGPAAELDLPVVDLGGLPPAQAHEVAHRLVAEEVARPFDLAVGPLLRPALLRLGEDSAVLLFNLHHIVADGWSLEVLVRELAALYPAALARNPPPLPELPVQYADFALWQRSWLCDGVLAQQIGYWRGQLAGAPPRLHLPFDGPRAAGRESAAWFKLELERDLVRGARALAQRGGATLFMVLLASLQAVLERWTGQSDLSVGTPIAGRRRLELEGLIGCFINTLVLRGVLDSRQPFADHLRRTREIVLGAYANQDLPFEKLVEALQPERSLHHTPLFQVLLNLQNIPATGLELPALRLFPWDPGPAVVKFDLTFSLEEAADGGLELTLLYGRQSFDRATMMRLGRHLRTLLAGAVADSGRCSDELPLLAAAERHQLILEWSASDAPPIPELCVHQLFERQADRCPEALALVFEDERLTYREVETRANRLAHRLLQLGVAPEDRVALVLDRSAAAIIGLLGIIKAGAAYVPFDAASPGARLAGMLEEAGVRAIVTAERTRATLPADSTVPVLCLDGPDPAWAGSAERPAVRVLPGQLLYVLFTSGSTGRPKGVAVEHRQLVHYVTAVLARLDLEGAASFALVSTLAADLGNTSLFPALATGGTLHVLAPERTSDPAALAAYMSLHRIDCLKIVPSHLRALRSTQGAAVLPRRRLVLGGEPLAWPEAEEILALAPGCLVFNHYGPTESTVGVLACRVDRAQRRGGTVPLGRPLANVRALVLDALGRQAPIGVPGELLLGGAGLARGYLGRPDLTAARFVPDPLGGEPGSRLYRTGDLVRHLSDGSLQFLGRIDHQVKIRGFRVELGEVEAALADHPAVEEAVVAVHGEGDERRLVAYVVLVAASGADVGELRQGLRERLPELMVPGAWVVLPRLPLTPNGKVDRRALPAPEAGERLVPAAPPRDELELLLTRIWEDLLGVAAVGIHDSFFDLGGQSLLAMRLAAAIERRLGRRPTLADILQSPTVAGLAALLRSPDEAPRRALLLPIQPRGARPPLFCVHPVGGNVLCYLDLSRGLGPDQPLYGLQAAEPDPSLPAPGLEEMAATYLAQVRQVQPSGPYRLAGWSLGGVVAFEMARQLELAGECAALLAMIDVGPPGPRQEESDPTADLTLFAADLGGLADHPTAAPIDPARFAALVHGKSLEEVLTLPEIRAVLPPEIGPRQARELFALFQRNLRAVRAYRPGPYGGHLSLIRAEATAAAESGTEAGWTALAGSIEVQVLPGDHYSLLHPPHVTALCARLQAHLVSRMSSQGNA